MEDSILPNLQEKNKMTIYLNSKNQIINNVSYPTSSFDNELNCNLDESNFHSPSFLFKHFDRF